MHILYAATLFDTLLTGVTYKTFLPILLLAILIEIHIPVWQFCISLIVAHQMTEWFRGINCLSIKYVWHFPVIHQVTSSSHGKFTLMGTNLYSLAPPFTTVCSISVCSYSMSCSFTSSHSQAAFPQQIPHCEPAGGNRDPGRQQRALYCLRAAGWGPVNGGGWPTLRALFDLLMGRFD